MVASQPIEDSRCDLTSNDQSSSTATTSTAATPQAQDFSGQTSKSLLHNTPIKKKQRKVIRARGQKIRRLRKTLEKKSSKKITEEKALEIALAKLPENLANFVKIQVNLHSKKKKGRRYSPQLKSLAISIYHASGKAYRMLYKIVYFANKNITQAIHIKTTSYSWLFPRCTQYYQEQSFAHE